MYELEKLDFGTSGIYLIRNVLNNKFYIGSAKCLRKRFNDHINKLKRNKHPNNLLQNVYNKHGIEVLQATLLEGVVDRAMLVVVEQKYLDRMYDNQKLCYNICPTAGSALGRKHSKETRHKISQAHQGKKFSVEVREKISKAKQKQKHLHFKSGKNNPMYGKTEGKHPMYGKKHTKESKRKMSLSSKGVPNLKLAITVAQYDLNGKLLTTYTSASEAERKTKIRGIRACASKIRKSAGGFMWSYEIMDKIEPYLSKRKKRKPSSEQTRKKISTTKRIAGKPIQQIDKKTQQVICVYTCISAAEEKTSINGIGRCCNGSRKTAGGFIWRYESSI